MTHLSSRLAGVGRQEEALEAIDEAVRIRRRLVLARPDAFEPELAGTLNHLAVLLARSGRWEEALAGIGESVGVYRRLVLARPDAFEPELVGTLNHRAILLAHLGRGDDALDAVEEAMRRMLRLLERRPVGLADRGRSLLDSYRQLCTRLGTEPDGALITRLHSAVAAARQESKAVT